MPNGSKSYQKTINGITIGKNFINETFAKNIHNKQLASLMEVATEIEKWLPKAGSPIRIEDGRHHDCKFKVYNVEYKGKIIEFKTMDKSGETIYTMRFIK